MRKGTIYKITTKHNGLIYIGQTIQSVKKRWRGHLSHLGKGQHHNYLLQRVYDKYGADDFVFEVIERCRLTEIDERERFWISFYDTINREKGYNFESGGNELKKHCPETIERMRSASRGHNNKLTLEQVTEIKKRIIAGVSFKELAEKFNVSDSCIYRIKNLQNWEYISPELNEDLRRTDTSRDIKRLSNDEINECKKLIMSGEPPFNLAKKYEIPYGRFSKLFRCEIDLARYKWKELIEPVKVLFFENLSVCEILAKTKITYRQYKKITYGLEEVRHARNVEYVGKAKAEGKTNSEIAKELNVNRCTITVYWKEYKQKYADTVIS